MAEYEITNKRHSCHFHLQRLFPCPTQTDMQRSKGKFHCSILSFPIHAVFMSSLFMPNPTCLSRKLKKRFRFRGNLKMLSCSAFRNNFHLTRMRLSWSWSSLWSKSKIQLKHSRLCKL